MKKIFLAVIIFSSLNLLAQKKLFMPSEFVNSYENEFRNFDGTPGKNYFSNYADYNIDVFFNPENGFLKASADITYHNQSNDTLEMIIIRLYKNLFQKGNLRDFAVNPTDVNNGINIKSFYINEKEYNLNDASFYGTNMYVQLPEPLKNNSKLSLSIEWELIMPQNTTIRNGKYGENIYMIAYWYPQIAVYDDVFGWDTNIFGGTQEFYNEHSNFNVKITVPSPNIVWATGMLENPYKIFTKKYAMKIDDALKSDEVVSILSQEDYKSGNILKNNDENTWKFKAQKVPDFAFSTSANHNWDATGTYVPNRPQRILISGVYADSSKIFHSLTKVSRKIINYFSFKKPQIYYPYPAMTVFEGGGGMEYPMMVNIGDIESPCDFYYVVAHEIAHSYFPFYTGTSETRYAWMDEGIISFFPRYAVDEIFNSCNTVKSIYKNYNRIAGTVNDFPMMFPSSIFNDFYIYRNIAYNRPAYAFYILHEHLGDSLFYEALREFTERWHYKHPYPYDFFYTFEDVANEDLTWFWQPFFFEFSKPDLSFKDVYFDAGLYIEIENSGGLPLPVDVKIYLKNGKIQNYHKNIDVWKNKDVINVYIPLKEKPDKLILENSMIPDVNKSDNLFVF